QGIYSSRPCAPPRRTSCSRTRQASERWPAHATSPGRDGSPTRRRPTAKSWPSIPISSRAGPSASSCCGAKGAARTRCTSPRGRLRVPRDAGRYQAAEVAYEGAAQAAEHAEQREAAEREILVTRRYAFYAPRRPEDLAPAERWFAETGSVVLAAAAGGDVPDDATLVQAFLDLASDSGWRFGQVVTVGPALPAWQALAEELRLPLSGRAAFDPEAVPLVVAQRPLPGDAGWSALPSAVARGGAGLVFVLEQAAEDTAVTGADVIGVLSDAGRRHARGINVAHALSEAQHPAARWAGRRLKP